MKRSWHFLLVLLIFLLSLGIFIWIFFPWEAGSEYGLARFSNNLNSRGIYFEHGSLEKEGLVRPVLTVSDASIQYLMGTLEMDSVKASPRILSSLAAMKPSVYVEISEGVFLMGGKEKTGFEKGTMLLRSSADRVYLDQLSLTGDIQVSGDMVIDPSGRTILSAALELKVPEDLEVFVKALSALGDLKRSGSGVWTFRKEKGGQ
jgi:hypothetical protein